MLPLGQQAENPLLLLGQYSDDGLDEKENKIHNENVAQNSPIDQNEQVEDLVQDSSDDKDRAKEVTVSDISKEPIPGSINLTGSIKNTEDSHIGESDVPALRSSYNEAEPVAQECASGTSGMQIVGDMTNEWKIVMHEETNQYYYWNTVTGETSWEVPYVLGQGMETSTQHKVSLSVEENVSNPEDHYVSGSNLNGEVKAPLSVPGLDGLKSGMQTFTEGAKIENGEVSNFSPAAEQVELNNNPTAADLSCVESHVLRDSVSMKQSSILYSEQGELTMTLNGKGTNNSMVSITNPEGMTSYSSQIMKFGESLLQRLKTFEGPVGNTQGIDWKSKYVLEVEIRLSDCKAFSAYGPSLLPFWQHTEAQLKQIELALGAEVSIPAKSGENVVDEVAQATLLETDDTLHQSNGTDLEACGENRGVLESAVSSVPIIPSTNIVAVTSEVHHESGCDEEPPCNVTVGEAMEEVKENTVPAHSYPKSGVLSSEELDMDVDMEVDEEIPAKNTKDPPSTEPLATVGNPINQDSCLPLVEYPSLVPAEECCALPPPDEEWIPPPPPDNEPIPPPPPDEPEHPPLPPYTEPVPPLLYTEQYNVAYTVPPYDYYATTHTEVSNYYSHSEVTQIAEPQLQQYYEQPVNVVIPEAVAAPANPAEPLVYYDVPNGTVPPVPMVTGIESSGFYGESKPINYHDNTSDHKPPIGVVSEPGFGSLSNLMAKSDFSKINTDVQMGAVLPSSLPATAQAAMAVDEHAVSGTSTVAIVTTEPFTASTAAAKSQAKARGKKRIITAAPTLRSNKKVNSLVDKWKAAKEELHAEEEDEPENAYEILERKKQREIEEWRARQIASGEALDNANFQPLGGDWREKVKRRRAGSASETAQTPVEVSTNENQQPSLAELSKDLPSGWQAYWDESSKQVYYGNAITSETTWTRPAR